MGATQFWKRARPHAENPGNELERRARSGTRGEIKEPRRALDASSGSVKWARGRVDGRGDAGSTRQQRRIRWWVVCALVPLAFAILQTPTAAVQPPARAEQFATQGPPPHAGHTTSTIRGGGETFGEGELAGEDVLTGGKNASGRRSGGRKLTDSNNDADGWAKDGTIRDELALAEGAQCPSLPARSRVHLVAQFGEPGLIPALELKGLYHTPSIKT